MTGYDGEHYAGSFIMSMSVELTVFQIGCNTQLHLGKKCRTRDSVKR